MGYMIYQSGKAEWLVYHRGPVAGGLTAIRILAVVSSQEAAHAALRLVQGVTSAHQA